MPPERIKVGGIGDPIWYEPITPGERRHVRLVPVALVAAVILGVGYPTIASLLSRRDYGTFAFWKLPKRIDYCGRRYYGEGKAEGTSTSLTASVAGAPTWETVGHTFSLRSIEAPVTRRTSRSDVCTMTAYVPTGNARFAQYVLSGGP